jgi:hypothetical protein
MVMAVEPEQLRYADVLAAVVASGVKHGISLEIKSKASLFKEHMKKERVAIAVEALTKIASSELSFSTTLIKDAKRNRRLIRYEQWDGIYCEGDSNNFFDDA